MADREQKKYNEHQRHCGLLTLLSVCTLHLDSRVSCYCLVSSIDGRTNDAKRSIQVLGPSITIIGNTVADVVPPRYSWDTQRNSPIGTGWCYDCVRTGVVRRLSRFLGPGYLACCTLGSRAAAWFGIVSFECRAPTGRSWWSVFARVPVVSVNLKNSHNLSSFWAVVE